MIPPIRRMATMCHALKDSGLQRRTQARRQQGWHQESSNSQLGFSKPPGNSLQHSFLIGSNFNIGEVVGDNFIFLSWQLTGRSDAHADAKAAKETSSPFSPFPNTASPKWDLENSPLPQDLLSLFRDQEKDLGWQGDSGGVALETVKEHSKFIFFFKEKRGGWGNKQNQDLLITRWMIKYLWLSKTNLHAPPHTHTHPEAKTNNTREGLNRQD